MMTRDSFHMAERIIGASRHSIQLKADDGGTIFCSNKVFGLIMSNPGIEFRVVTLREHEDPRTGRWFPETRWIEAYVPTRF